MALKLGHINVNRMARAITYKQLLEWMAYYELEPFDEVRADYRSAQIVQMMYNINRDMKQDPNGKGIDEFLLKFGEREEAPKQDLDEKMRIMALVSRAMAEAAKDQQAALPKVIEYVYPVPGAPEPEAAATAEVEPVIAADAMAKALATARAAIH